MEAVNGGCWMTTKQLLNQAKKLDIEQRTSLAHLIWMSVEDECADHEDEMSDELKRKIDARLDDLEKNPDAAYTLEEFMRMRKLKFKRAGRRKVHA
jgi:putative addiction module component (TIGR02574 family)